MKALALLLAVAGCASQSAPPVAAPVIEPVAVKPLPVSAPAAVAIVKKFDRVKARELSVVLAPDVTREQLDEIRAAGDRSKQALTKLGLQRTRPTAAALQEARDAVAALDAALAATSAPPSPAQSPPSRAPSPDVR